MSRYKLQRNTWKRWATIIFFIIYILCGMAVSSISIWTHNNKLFNVAIGMVVIAIIMRFIFLSDRYLKWVDK